MIKDNVRIEGALLYLASSFLLRGTLYVQLASLCSLHHHHHHPKMRSKGLSVLLAAQVVRGLVFVTDLPAYVGTASPAITVPSASSRPRNSNTAYPPANTACNSVSSSASMFRVGASIIPASSSDSTSSRSSSVERDSTSTALDSAVSPSVHQPEYSNSAAFPKSTLESSIEKDNCSSNIPNCACSTAASPSTTSSASASLKACTTVVVVPVTTFPPSPPPSKPTALPTLHFLAHRSEHPKNSISAQHSPPPCGNSPSLSRHPSPSRTLTRTHTTTTTTDTTITKPAPGPSSSLSSAASKVESSKTHLLVYTSVIMPDPRCPYPFPGVHCRAPETTLVTGVRRGG